MTKFADLHIHTHYSDSTYSPLEVIEEAKRFGVDCIAITDHDTFDGIEETKKHARIRDLEIIGGIELSSDVDGKDVHLLGYFFSGIPQGIREEVIKMQEARVQRMKEMIAKLKELNIDGIDFDEVMSLTRSKSVGRLHLAMKLKEKGIVSSYPEAFTRFIGEDCPAYVPKYKLSTYQAIDLINKAGGIPVLAHPAATAKDECIAGFVQAGLKGIEVYYPNHSPSAVGFYEGLAKKYGLMMTGGSDAHGEGKKDIYVGKTKIPYSFVENLKEVHSGG